MNGRVIERAQDDGHGDRRGRGVGGEPYAGCSRHGLGAALGSRAWEPPAPADDPGEPVTRVRVRALMIPPGIPDWFTRRRVLEAGRIQLSGRAWSGNAPIERVDVGIDGAWHGAALGPPAGPFAWRPWSFEWDATVGEHELSCRATDASGNTQPLDAPWNYQGHGNNAVQRVSVTVR